MRLLELSSGTFAKNLAAMQRNLVYDYSRSPEAVIENDQVKLSWDFRIQTEHH